MFGSGQIGNDFGAGFASIGTQANIRVKRRALGTYRVAKRPRLDMPKSRRPMQVVDANAQAYGRSSSKYSRRKKGFYRKLIRSAKESRYLRIQGITLFSVGQGYLRCDQSSVTPASTTVNWPLYLFDYKATNNINNGAQDLGTVLWRMTSASTSSTANVTFINNYRLLQDSTGATGATAVWQPENTPGVATSDNTVHRKVHLEYVMGKFLLYGTLTRPVRWRIEVIGLNHDWLHPDFALTTDVVSGTVNPLAERNMFWQHLIKNYTESPLCVQNPKYRKYYTVYKTIYDGIIEPKLSTEPASDVGATDVSVPHMKQVDYFDRVQTICKYDWNDVGLQSWDNIGFTVNTGETKGVVSYKARRYIMIRALAPINNTNVTADAADLRTDPTFDFVMRKKEIMINS